MDDHWNMWRLIFYGEGDIGGWQKNEWNLLRQMKEYGYFWGECCKNTRQEFCSVGFVCI